MEVNADLKLLEKDVQEVKEKLMEVHGAIVGNALTKEGGIAKRLTEAEDQLMHIDERLDIAEKKQIKYNVYTIVMWASLGGVATAIFLYIINQFFLVRK